MWLLLVVALACTALAAWAAARLERQRLALQFRDAGSTLARRLQRELHGVVNDLHAVHALFDVAPSVDRAGFAEFVRPLLVRHPGLIAIEWVPRVRAADLSEYERRARADGLDFRVTEHDESGRVSLTARRDEHYPVYYFEPRAGNEAAFGLDLASGAERREALYAARDSGVAAVAGPLRLVQSTQGPVGYLVLLPRYARGERADSSDARRDSFAGVVLGVVRISHVLTTTPDVQASDELDLEIVDAGRVIATAGMSGSAAVETAESDSAFDVIELPLVLADHELTLRVRARPAFIASHRTRIPSLVAAGGGIFCVVLALYLGSLRREYAARERIDIALVESEHRYRTLVEHAPEAVVVYDVDAGVFVDANANAAKMLEVPREKLLASSPLDFSPVLQPDGRESAIIIEEMIQRTLSGESPVVPWNRKAADGTELPVEVRAIRLPDANRNLLRCSIIDVRDRRQSELRQLMMARELDHRFKNNLATVLSIAEQTCASARSIEEFREAFVGRVRAMARTHEALAARRWDGVPLGEIAHLTLDPYTDGSPDRATVRGEPVRLSPAASSCLCMALHELAANAAKYGALSEAAGRIDLAWSRAEDGSLAVEWAERDGPRVLPPTTAGFGSRLINGVLSHELGGRVTLEYGIDGVSCRMQIPAEHWTAERGSV